MTSILTLDGITPKLGAEVFVAPNAVLIGDVVVGALSGVWFGAVLRGDLMPIRVGARSSVQDNCVLHTTNGQTPTVVGDACTVGHGVILHGCTIEHRVLVGMGSVVMDEAVVGSDTILGAGSLVTVGCRIPPGVLALGRPAKVIRDLRPDEIELVLDSAERYVSYRGNYLAQLNRP